MENWEATRIVEYGDIGKQLDMLWHAIDADEDLKIKFADFYNHVKTVKTENPKP
jgi:hypothetical protein